MREQRRVRGIGRTVAAFGIGALLGSVAALLYAPTSGVEARKRLGNQMRLVRRRAVQLRQDANLQFKQARKWMLARIPANRNGHERRTTRRPAHA
jgi:gas vesicle protein